MLILQSSKTSYVPFVWLVHSSDPPIVNHFMLPTSADFSDNASPRTFSWTPGGNFLDIKNKFTRSWIKVKIKGFVEK